MVDNQRVRFCEPLFLSLNNLWKNTVQRYILDSKYIFESLLRKYIIADLQARLK